EQQAIDSAADTAAERTDPIALGLAAQARGAGRRHRGSAEWAADSTCALLVLPIEIGLSADHQVAELKVDAERAANLAAIRVEIAAAAACRIGRIAPGA